MHLTTACGPFSQTFLMMMTARLLVFETILTSWHVLSSPKTLNQAQTFKTGNWKPPLEQARKPQS